MNMRKTCQHVNWRPKGEGVAAFTLEDALLPALAFLGRVLLLQLAAQCSMCAMAQELFTYEVGDGAITITGLQNECCPAATEVDIPGTIAGLPVTCVGKWAFSRVSLETWQNSYRLSSVSMPDSVTNIADYAFFYSPVLTNVLVGSGVTAIGGQAFALSSNLTSICFRGNAPAVDPSAFDSDDALTVYYLPGTSGWGPSLAGRPTLPLTSAQFLCTTGDGTAVITGYIGFGGAVSLPAELDGLPVTGIGDAAFQNCARLAGVTIPDSMRTVDDSAFESCVGLTNVLFGAGVTNIGAMAFACCSSLTNLTFPAQLAVIGDSAFLGCNALTNLALDTGLTDIGPEAFALCSSLTRVAIPRAIANIGSGAFSQCSSLSAITVDPLNPSYSSLGGVLFNKDQSALLAFPAGLAGAYAPPNSVAIIGDDAFAGCGGLTSITIPSTVAGIGVNAFIGCSSLAGAALSNGVLNIGDGAFSGSGLTNIAIPDSVTNLGRWTFSGCPNLAAITLGRGLHRIEEEEFEDCSSLIQVDIPQGVTNIGFAAFAGCAKLTNLTLPSTVTGIDTSAFPDCASLVGIYFEGNAPAGDSSVFNSDSAVTVYYLPGATGWGPTFGGAPTRLWNPTIQADGPGFGLGSQGFGFTIRGTESIPVLVEACSNLANPTWTAVAATTLAGGSAYFCDPAWTNYSIRLYRLRWP